MEDIPHQLHSVKKEIESVHKKVDTIFSIVVGNEYDATMGLLNKYGQVISKMEQMEKKFEDSRKEDNIRFLKLEKWKDRISYIAIGISLAAGGGIWAALQALFGKK